jgi:hypothetical protein
VYDSPAIRRRCEHVFVRSKAEVNAVLALVGEGHTDSGIARLTGIPRTTVRDWRMGRVPKRSDRGGNWRPCPICAPGSVELPPSDYIYLLGLYLGDGCISRGPRTYCLRFFLDSAYPGIIEACRRSLGAIRPSQHAWIRPSRSSRCHIVAMCSNHWPCLFPQHGPGRKHERRIALSDWQAELLDEHREPFIRGLIHSDGCRVVANDRGLPSVRYHFSNKSEDIKRLYCASLDALGVRWTRPCDRQIAVYRKASVAILDEFVGPKR